MRARALVALIALLAFIEVLVISNTAYRKRRQQRAILEDKLEQYAAQIEEPFIDMRIVLRVVVGDPHGRETDPSKLEVVSEHLLGGILEVKTKRLAGWAFDREPRIWYASEQQAEILFEREVLAQLVEGSEGSGKTTVLAQWHYIQWLRHLGEGREGLQTAPTNARLGLVKKEITKLWRPEWYRYVDRKDFTGFELCDGSALRMISTRKASEADGDRIQGFNSSWAGRDETQDQVDAHEGIESRGRAARRGEYPQLGTATVKDSAAYRNLKELITKNGAWLIRRLLMCHSIDGSLELAKIVMDTPFIARKFIESKLNSMSAREFRRRYFAEEQAPELAVYFEWLRSRNLVNMPGYGAYDVTPTILEPYGSWMSSGARFTLAAGHDPGVIFNTSEVARLMVIGGVPQWVVVGEFQTKQTTALEHAREFRKWACDTFDVERRLTTRGGISRPDPESPKIAVFIDPHGRGENKTDYQTHYGAFQAEGIDAFNPAAITGFVKRSARVDMMNRLLGGTAAAQGVARVVVAKSAPGEPCAPVLVRAFEELVKRPGEEDAEGYQRKDESDLTHAPAALSYLLWPFEQQALTLKTVETALAAAARHRA